VAQRFSNKNILTQAAGAEANMKVKLVYVTTIPMTLRLFLQGQIAYMKSKGFEVVGISSPGPDLKQVATFHEIPVYAVNMMRGMSPFKDLLALSQLTRLFMKIKPQIVHVSTFKAGLLSMLAASMASVAVRVYTLRGLVSELDPGPMNKLFKVLESIACRCACQVFAVSHSVADATVRDGICPRGKIRVLGNGSSNGVDAQNNFNPARIDEQEALGLREQYAISKNDVVLGFVGRLVRDKGIMELADVWSKLRLRYENARLLISGPEERGDPVPQQIMEALRNDPRVILTGLLPRSAMPRHYRIMDLVVLPTHREGFPNVVLEAGAMQLPVVATSVTGCVDAVIPGVTGELVPLKDTSALEAAIRHYIDDPSLRLLHGKAGRERVLKSFTQESIWEAHYNEYLRLLSEKGL
jgi:glycosyltransferase involved in cell wall biosynthesis